MRDMGVTRHGLRNLVNRHDLQRIRRKLRRGDLGSALAKLRGSSQDRIVRQWNDVDREPTQWWAVPAVRRRWNRIVTGDELVDFPAHVAARYLEGRSGLRALSIGCGVGGRELRWAELGVFERLDAFDIAPATVAEAKARAEAAGLAQLLQFEVRDFRALDTEERYDVVLAEHSLHHLAPMPQVVERVGQLLVPGGLFVVDEFVGPSRFQWTGRQVREAQAVLDRFPDRYRQMGTAGVKTEVTRPSVLWMLMTDPSEAIDSSRIPQALHNRFDVLEERPYGGAVLHLALADIAQNFTDDDDPVAAALLAEAFDTEDRLMADGVVESDFVTYVCREREERR